MFYSIYSDMNNYNTKCYYNVNDCHIMGNGTHTINILLMEDKSTVSVVDFFKKENNVKVHLFDNLDDILDGLKVCSDRSNGCMHFILIF